MTAPLEVRVAGAMILGAGLLFVGLGVAMSALRTPALFLAVAAAAVAVLTVRKPHARMFVAIAATLLATAHAVLALGSAPWWARVGLAVAAVADAYAVILVQTGPARAYFGGVRDERS